MAQWMDKLEVYIEEQIKEQSIPGLAMTFSDGDGNLFSKGFGHIDAQRNVPTSPDTVMGIASLSKSLTAVCLALLESEGKLSFDDSVVKYFPNLKIPGTPKDALLIRHLITHTAGLPPLPLLMYSWAANTVRDPEEKFDVDELESYPPIRTVDEIIEFINAGEYASLGQPGEYMSYSNDSYALLSSIVDMAAGIPLEEYMRAKLFTPLGMTHTSFDLDSLRVQGNVTSLFTKEKDKPLACSDNWAVCPPYRGCGFIFSTSHDMHAYYKMLSQNGAYDGRAILPPDAAERMLGSEIPTRESGCYGYGLNKFLFERKTFFHHTGGLKGVSSAGGFLKDEGVAGCVLTNIGNIRALPVLYAAVNGYLGLPADAPHAYYVPSGRTPSEPHIYLGQYGGMEDGLPADAKPVAVTMDADGALTITDGEGTRKQLAYCFENAFLAVEEGKNPLDGILCRFLVRGDSAWSVNYGSRILQRV